MLLMVGKCISGGICHDAHRYANANNKCMKNYDPNKESSYLMDCDFNSPYWQAMGQNLPVDDFK